jgi:hypothetical protein
MTQREERESPAPAPRGRPRGPLKLGRIVATPGALTALSRAGQRAADFLLRHQRGDWGDVDADDAAANDRAAAGGGEQVLSAYRLRTGTPLW